MPRVFVACVPRRAAARCATTTWWISGMFTCAAKIFSGSSTESPVAPSGD
jgi:hypothetical protein